MLDRPAKVANGRTRSQSDFFSTIATATGREMRPSLNKDGLSLLGFSSSQIKAAEKKKPLYCTTKKEENWHLAVHIKSANPSEGD